MEVPNPKGHTSHLWPKCPLYGCNATGRLISWEIHYRPLILYPPSKMKLNSVSFKKSFLPIMVLRPDNMEMYFENWWGLILFQPKARVFLIMVILKQLYILMTWKEPFIIWYALFWLSKPVWLFKICFINIIVTLVTDFHLRQPVAGKPEAWFKRNGEQYKFWILIGCPCSPYACGL